MKILTIPEYAQLIRDFSTIEGRFEALELLARSHKTTYKVENKKFENKYSGKTKKNKKEYQKDFKEIKRLSGALRIYEKRLKYMEKILSGMSERLVEFEIQEN
jgi:DNA mismatch repair ATPase MutS